MYVLAGGAEGYLIKYALSVMYFLNRSRLLMSYKKAVRSRHTTLSNFIYRKNCSSKFPIMFWPCLGDTEVFVVSIEVTQPIKIVLL